MIAARNGADPDMNPKLRLAVYQARKASMPKDTLERAIKKGAGLSGEVVNYDRTLYEGFAPHQVPVIVECLTDNRTRTASNVRVLFRKGQLAAAGAVSWDFEHLGAIEASPPAPGAVNARNLAILPGVFHTRASWPATASSSGGRASTISRTSTSSSRATSWS